MRKNYSELWYGLKAVVALSGRKTWKSSELLRIMENMEFLQVGKKDK